MKNAEKMESVTVDDIMSWEPCEPYTADRVMHLFACWLAEQALQAEREAGREPDPASWAAVETKRRWLNGMASDKELAAARYAAWAAAEKVPVRGIKWNEVHETGKGRDDENQ